MPKPKEVSQAQKKISQARGSRYKGTTKEKNGRPKRLEAQRKKEEASRRKRNPRQEIKENSQDPQQPPRGTDPSRRISTVKGRLRQFERKGQENKIRNKVEAISAKRPNKKRGNNQ